jgi:oligopeptide transport system substrate-binding protein
MTPLLRHMFRTIRRHFSVPNDILVLTGIILLTSTVLTGCSAVQTNPKNSATAVNPLPAQTLVLNLGTEPPTLDPALAVDLTSGTVIDLLFQGLTTFDAHANVKPAVASRWELSTDELTYTFYLRPDAQWSDGKHVTAQQFVAAWQRILTPETAAQYANFLFPIKGAKAFYEKKLSHFSQVGVKATAPHVLTVTLEKPLSFFPSLMALPVALPIRAELIQKFGKQFTEPPHFVGNGAYKLHQWKHEDFIRLSPNPRYFQHRQTTHKRPDILFRMIADANTSTLLFNHQQLDLLESGTSISAFDYATYAKHPNAQQAPIGMVQYLGFNTQKAPFNTPLARRAFCQCLQRQYFPALLKSGQTPIKGFIEPNLPFFNPNSGLAENIPLAQKHWQQVVKTTAKIPPITLGFRNGYDTRKQAEILQFFWKQHLGATVQLQNADWKVYLQRLKTDAPQLFLLTWYMDYPDADSFLSLFHSSNGNNHTRWHSAMFDKLIEQASQTNNTTQRQRLYNQAQTILLEKEAAICPLFTLKKLWVTQPRVRGIQFNSLNQLMLDEVTLVEQTQKQ